ncbi:MAG: Bcr/CflA family efflux MFS transporter [Pseudomonadota bacterium]
MTGAAPPDRVASQRSAPGLVTLVLVTALSTLSLNMFLPSLGAIAAEFEAEYALVNLSVALYLAVTAVLQIMIGPLSDRFGRRPVMLSALSIFVFASLGCLLAPDVATFLLFRMIQGAAIAGGVMAPAILRDTRSEAEAASLIGYVSMAMAVGPMTGPMVGGVLEELFGWRASFVLFTGLGVCLLALCWVDLGETHHTRATTLTAQARAYPDLLGTRRFWGYALCMAFSTSAFYAFLSGVPVVAETVLEISPSMLGLCLGSITAGFAVGSFLAGRFGARIGLMRMIVAGRLVAAAGLLIGLAFAVMGQMSVLTLFGATLFVGIGNGITMPGTSVGAMSVRRDLAGSAAGLAGALTVGIGAAVSTATGHIVASAGTATALFAVMLACVAASVMSLALIRTRAVAQET